MLPPEIFHTVPGTARVQFLYFPSSLLFRGEEGDGAGDGETWRDTGGVLGASLRHSALSNLPECVVYQLPNSQVQNLFSLFLFALRKRKMNLLLGTQFLPSYVRENTHLLLRFWQ